MELLNFAIVTTVNLIVSDVRVHGTRTSQSHQSLFA